MRSLSDGTFWAGNEYAKVFPELLPFVPWGTWIANFSISDGAVLSASSLAIDGIAEASGAGSSKFDTDAFFALLTADEEPAWIGSRPFGRGRKK